MKLRRICFQLKKKIISEKDCFGKTFDYTCLPIAVHSIQIFIFYVFFGVCPSLSNRVTNICWKRLPLCSNNTMKIYLKPSNFRLIMVVTLVPTKTGHTWQIILRFDLKCILFSKTDLWWAASRRNIFPLDTKRKYFVMNLYFPNAFISGFLVVGF